MLVLKDSTLSQYSARLQTARRRKRATLVVTFMFVLYSTFTQACILLLVFFLLRTEALLKAAPYCLLLIQSVSTLDYRCTRHSYWRGRRMYSLVLAIFFLFRLVLRILRARLWYFVYIAALVWVFSMLSMSRSLFSFWLPLWTGMFPRNLEHVVTLQYWPAPMLSRCDYRLFSPSSFMTLTEIPNPVDKFSFQYLVTCAIDPIPVRRAGRRMFLVRTPLGSLEIYSTSGSYQPCWDSLFLLLFLFFGLVFWLTPPRRDDFVPPACRALVIRLV